MPVLDDAGIEAVLRSARRIAIIGASADLVAPRIVSSATWSTTASNASP